MCQVMCGLPCFVVVACTCVDTSGTSSFDTASSCQAACNSRDASPSSRSHVGCHDSRSLDASPSNLPFPSARRRRFGVCSVDATLGVSSLETPPRHRYHGSRSLDASPRRGHHRNVCCCVNGCRETTTSVNATSNHHRCVHSSPETSCHGTNSLDTSPMHACRNGCRAHACSLDTARSKLQRQQHVIRRGVLRRQSAVGCCSEETLLIGCYSNSDLRTNAAQNSDAADHRNEPAELTCKENSEGTKSNESRKSFKARGNLKKMLTSRLCRQP